jgi:hypothetical protein
MVDVGWRLPVIPDSVQMDAILAQSGAEAHSGPLPHTCPATSH